MWSYRSLRVRIVIAMQILLVAITVATLAGAQTSQPAPSVDTARARYEAGVAAYRAGRFREAVDAFLAADRLSPRAALSFNIARAYDKLEDVAKALEYYRDYLRREAAPQNGAETRARVSELEAALAHRGVQQVSVRSEPSGASLRIDGRLVGTTPWTGELTPGKHWAAVSVPGQPEQSREFELTAARAIDLEFDVGGGARSGGPTPSQGSDASAEAAPAANGEARAGSSVTPWQWVALGAGAAALTASLAVELSRQGIEDDLPGTANRDYEDRYDTMESRKTTARVLLGAGAALAITGGVLLYLDGREQSSARIGCGPAGCIGRWETRF
jgi:tetratricopeptide (TPR) repeat protein